jgi:hypothetical protein
MYSDGVWWSDGALEFTSYSSSVNQKVTDMEWISPRIQLLMISVQSQFASLQSGVDICVFGLLCLVAEYSDICG